MSGVSLMAMVTEMSRQDLRRTDTFLDTWTRALFMARVTMDMGPISILEFENANLTILDTISIF